MRIVSVVPNGEEPIFELGKNDGFCITCNKVLKGDENQIHEVEELKHQGHKILDLIDLQQGTIRIMEG